MREYFALADSLRHDREYAFSGEASRMRQPLYPLLIASVQAIDGNSLKPLQYLQTLLVAASMGITYLLGTRLLALFLAVGLLIVVPSIKARLDGAASQEREREVARSDQRDP